MTRYISSTDNLKLMMNMLKEKSRNIQFEAFHVFKVFHADSFYLLKYTSLVPYLLLIEYIGSEVDGFSGVCLFVILSVSQHDNFQMIKCRMMKLGG